MGQAVTSFTLQDVVAGLEARVDELIAVTLRGQGLNPIAWAKRFWTTWPRTTRPSATP